MHEDLFNYKIIQPANKVDANVKKTGFGWYVDEYKLLSGLTYGVFVNSIIITGRIKAIDIAKAIRVPGVLTVLTHLNKSDITEFKSPSKVSGEPASKEKINHLFYDDGIRYYEQPVALVIADNMEAAVKAAKLVKISYIKEEHRVSTNTRKIKIEQTDNFSESIPDEFHSAEVKIEATYSTALQVKDPMEMHAAIVIPDLWNDIKDLNKIHAAKSIKKAVTSSFALKEENVKVHFSLPGNTESFAHLLPQEMATIMGAKKTGRPLIVMVSRSQVFNMLGYQPSSVHLMGLGTALDGTIGGMTHEVFVSTSSSDELGALITDTTKSLYNCANIHTRNKRVHLNIIPPSWAKDTGATCGSFALESALDELSYLINIDPVDLRLKNFAEQDPQNGLPWSTNYLKECYELGIQSSGWSARNPKPGSMRSGDWLLGMGMSAGTCYAGYSAEPVTATFDVYGRLTIQGPLADGSSVPINILTQVADTFGIDVSGIEFIASNPSRTDIHNQNGSYDINPQSAVIHDLVIALQKRIKELAISSRGTILSGRMIDGLILEKGILRDKHTGEGLSIIDLLEHCNLPAVQATIVSEYRSEEERVSVKTFCAHFVEVLIHPLTSKIKVSKVVTTIDAGKVQDIKTAAGQVYNSIINSLGISLAENSFINNRPTHHDKYIPLNTDIPAIEIIFVNKPDPFLGTTGFKGIAEIGRIGFPAAVANAVYHATGKRVRSLPISLDK